jgi:hypothetical protein
MAPEHALDPVMLKLLGTLAFTGTVVGEFFVQGQAMPFFGVTLSTLGMAAAGSMIAFAYGSPVNSRRKLYGYAIGGTFVGVWAVQILPGWLGWSWYLPQMEAPLAGFVALLSRWIVPFLIEEVPAILARRSARSAGKEGE